MPGGQQEGGIHELPDKEQRCVGRGSQARRGVREGSEGGPGDLVQASGQEGRGYGAGNEEACNEEGRGTSRPSGIEGPEDIGKEGVGGEGGDGEEGGAK